MATGARHEPMLDTGRLYAELLARGFSAHQAIRSLTYLLGVFCGPRR